MIEPAAGVGRTVLAVLCDAYDEEEVAGEQRTRAASCTRAWRRSRSPCCRSCARTASPSSPTRSSSALRGQLQAEYDEGGSIGKRYRRQDEIGTPFCVTIDHQSLEDRTVTVRDRDSLAQERVAVDELPARPRRAPRRSLADAEAGLSRRRGRRRTPRDRAADAASSSCAGVALSAQAYINGRLGESIGSAEAAAAINNGVGLVGAAGGHRGRRRHPARAALAVAACGSGTCSAAWAARCSSPPGRSARRRSGWRC